MKKLSGLVNARYLLSLLLSILFADRKSVV